MLVLCPLGGGGGGFAHHSSVKWFWKSFDRKDHINLSTVWQFSEIILKYMYYVEGFFLPLLTCWVALELKGQFGRTDSFEVAHYFCFASWKIDLNSTFELKPPPPLNRPNTKLSNGNLCFPFMKNRTPTSMHFRSNSESKLRLHPFRIRLNQFLIINTFEIHFVCINKSSLMDNKFNSIKKNAWVQGVWQSTHLHFSALALCAFTYKILLHSYVFTSPQNNHWYDLHFWNHYNVVFKHSKLYHKLHIYLDICINIHIDQNRSIAT